MPLLLLLTSGGGGGGGGGGQIKGTNQSRLTTNRSSE